MKLTTEHTESTERKLSGEIIGAAIEVHKELGPGLLESAYESCLIYELQQRKCKVEHQKSFSVNYKGIPIDCGYRLDLLVENQVIIEVKCVDRILPLHEAQLLSYLKFCNLQLGLIINFNVKVLKNGIRRMIL